jgi:hypothetical protein
LSLTRHDSDAQILPFQPFQVSESGASDTESATKDTFYERVQQSRSAHCRHTKHYSCLNNALADITDNFKNGFIGSFLMAAIPLLIKFKLKALVKLIFNKAQWMDSCKLALFSGLLNATYKAVLCLIRRCYSADRTERAN